MKAIVVALLAVSLFGFRPVDSGAARRGRMEAARDIRAGQLILRTYGLAGSAAYPREVLQRYGLKVQVVAGCVVDPRLIAETGGYNDAMRAEIKRRFGVAALNDLEPGRTR